MKPNIIFLVTDDQRYNTIHTLNNPDIQTPHIDTLVSRGTWFDQAFIMGGTCPAVCMPSRAMINTGRSLNHLVNSGETIPENHTLLGESLKSAGYQTCGIGKWHNGVDSYTRSFTSGGPVFFGGMDDHWNVPVCDYHPNGKYPQPKIHPWDGGIGTIEKIPKVFDKVASGVHSTDLFADSATRFLDNYEETAPYMMYVAFMAPHDPRTMPQRFKDMYDPDSLQLPPNLLPKHPFDNGELRVRDEFLEVFPRTEKAIRRHLAEYYAMITHLDEAIGRIMNAVEKRGDVENTIIVLCGDNGLALGSHGLMGKQNLYDHSIHVPLLWAGPKIAKGMRSQTPCYLYDIYPTLCEMLDIRTPSSVEGTSILPSLIDGSTFYPHGETMEFFYKDVQHCVMDKTTKKITYTVPGEPVRVQIFDRINDPYEMNPQWENHS